MLDQLFENVITESLNIVSVLANDLFSDQEVFSLAADNRVVCAMILFQHHFLDFTRILFEDTLFEEFLESRCKYHKH